MASSIRALLFSSPLLTSMIALAACGDDGETTPAPASTTASTTASTGGAGGGGTGGGGGAGGVPVPVCPDGWPQRAFVPVPEGDVDYFGPVGELTLPTLAGEFRFSELWNGCDAFVFFVYDPTQSYPDEVAAGDYEDWLEDSPPNVHYILVSNREDQGDVDDDISYMKGEFDDALTDIDPALAQHWSTRVHFVTAGLPTLDTWLNEAIDDYGWFAYGVDRTQLLREMHNWANPQIGFVGDIRYSGFEVDLFNFELAREDRLAGMNADVIPIFDEVTASDPDWAGGSILADVELPAAATMAAYDTLELDLTLDCGGSWFQACPAWDYLIYAFLCDVDDPGTPEDESLVCDQEIGRFITPYWQGGRWVVDASPFLALLRDGGTRKFRFYTQQPYTVSLDLRLSTSPEALGAPLDILPLWTGGDFDETYNAEHPPITFTPPAGTTRVELVAIVSGHGFGNDTENCAEFCNHEHEFTVNDAAPHLKDFPEAGTAEGCAEQVAEKGVSPNQAGTWVYGRGGWCPGLEVQPWRVDVTADVVPGEENVIEYRGLFEGQDYTPVIVPGGSGFAGRIDLASYLVFW